MKLLVVFIIVFAACADPVQTKRDVWQGFHPDDLAFAWEGRDSVEVNKWIMSLFDTTLTDYTFYSRVADLSNVTQFYYGNADPSEKSHWETPYAIRQMHRRNVAKVYLAYSKSCLFMNKTCWDETLPLQDRYRSYSTDFDSKQLIMISKAIDSICLKL